jgi:hypothetical protein
MRKVLAIFAVLICLNAVGIAVYVATNSAAVPQTTDRDRLQEPQRLARGRA